MYDHQHLLHHAANGTEAFFMTSSPIENTQETNVEKSPSLKLAEARLPKPGPAKKADMITDSEKWRSDETSGYQLKIHAASAHGHCAAVRV